MSEVIAELETETGGKVQKIDIGNGEIRYQRFGPARDGNGQFIKNQMGRSLFNSARESESIEQTLDPKTENERKLAVKGRYPEWENTKGRESGNYDSSLPKKETTIITFMGRKELQKQVENDPFVNDNEKDKALEALSRELVTKIENADSEREVSTILAQYLNS